MQREAHVMWADLGLGLANHGCQVSVFNFQFSTTVFPPTVDLFDVSRVTKEGAHSEKMLLADQDSRSCDHSLSTTVDTLITHNP